MLVVRVQIVPDGRDELRHVVETAPPNALSRQLAEPPLDQIEPRTRGRNKMEMEARMPLEPGLHAGMLVRPVVVHNQMQHALGQRLGVDLLQEPDELLMPMPRHAVADDRPIEQAQRREQGGRAVAFVIMRQRATAALLQRQARLRTIESLDLTFLVDGEDQGLVRWIKIQADHVIELLDKALVAADLRGRCTNRNGPRRPCAQTASLARSSADNRIGGAIRIPQRIAKAKLFIKLFMTHYTSTMDGTVSTFDEGTPGSVLWRSLSAYPRAVAAEFEQLSVDRRDRYVGLRKYERQVGPAGAEIILELVPYVSHRSMNIENMHRPIAGMNPFGDAMAGAQDQIIALQPETAE